MKRIFLSGPMSGYPNFNFAEFERVEEIFIAKGMKPISLRQLVFTVFDGDTSRSHREYMQLALEVLPTTDAIALLTGWEYSPGAVCEVGVALTLGLEFYNNVGDMITPPLSVVINRRD